MRGQLGTLNINGKQIGGFLDWEMNLRLGEVTFRGTRQYVIQDWKAGADSYWMFEIPDSNILNAIFYVLFQGELVAVSQNKVKVNIPPDTPLDKMLGHLEMQWTM